MKVGVANSFGGQLIDTRSFDVGSVTTEMRKTEIVDEDHHYVGRIGARVFCLGPPRSRLFFGRLNDPFELVVNLHQGRLLGPIESGARVTTHF